MKKVRIPFTLEEYSKGGYDVEVKDSIESKSVKVRVICTNRENDDYPIVILAKNNDGDEHAFYYTKNGKELKGKDGIYDLSLVKNEFEYGDIITTHGEIINLIIPYRGTDNDGGVLTEMYCDRADLKINTFSNAESGCGFTREYCLATEDEKQIFFDALAKIGKQWNAENKCIEDIKSKFYFKPKDWCLMSCGGYNEWVLCQFSNIKDLGYIAVGGKYFTQCIPYNDKTKHLLGTIYDATEKYKVW